MAYNVGEGTGNFQFTQSGKNVLKKIEDEIRKKVEKASLEVAQETWEQLSSPNGITPRDVYKKYYSGRKKTIKSLQDTWTMRARHSGSSINFELRNRSPHASLIYSEQESVGHSSGFRSAYPHEENPYLYIDGKRTVLEKRPNQLTKAKWDKFIINRKSAMTKAINKALKG